MLPIFVIFTLLMVRVSSSTISARQTSANLDCNVTCAPFISTQGQCVTTRCRCTLSNLQTQADCLICQASNAQEIAKIQLLMDAQINTCRSEGVDVERLHLLPATAPAVEGFTRQSNDLRQKQMAFLALQISGGHVALVILLVSSVYSSTIHRDPTFFNFCITWIFSSIVFSLNLYRGTAQNNIAEPLGSVDHDMCIAQAALVGGTQVMTACSKMALVMQLWLSVHMAHRGGYNKRPKRIITMVLLAAPWSLLLALVVPTILVGMHSKSTGVAMGNVVPGAFYCNVAVETLERIVYSLSLGFLVVAVIFDALIIRVLSRNWSRCQEFQAKSAIPLSILLRVVIFSVYRVSVAVAYGIVVGGVFVHRLPPAGGSVSYYADASKWVEILQASIPLVASLVFGFNGDVIKSLMFWRKRRPIGY